MLKIVKASIAIATTSLILTSPAEADINAALQNICTIVKTDDKGELRKKMKKVQSDYRIMLKDYYTGITCGGNSLIRTALLNNATETGELLVKKMPRSVLEKPETDGKTIQQWVNDNGLTDSPIAAALNKRI